MHHYRTALRFASSHSAAERAELLDALAAECMVTDQMDEALTAAEEALRLWNEVGDPIKVGATHVALEYICWYLGQGEAAVQHAAQAVAILEPHGPTVELGRALAGAGTFDVDRGDPHQAIVTLRRAIEIAHLVGDPYAESNALNSIGWAQGYYGDVDTGVTYLEQALEVALAHDLGHLGGRAYANLASVLVDNDRFDRADTVIADGLRYAEDHNLTLRYVCVTAVLADSELKRGRWDDAIADAWCIRQRAGTVAVGHIPALTTIGTIRMRRGEPDAHATLLEAMQLAERTGELPLIAPVALALTEEAWLRGDLAGARDLIRGVLDRSDQPVTTQHRGHLISWAVRLGGSEHDAPAGTPRHVALQINGRWQEAADAWQALGRPYERALALIEVSTPTGPDRGLRRPGPSWRRTRRGTRCRTSAISGRAGAPRRTTQHAGQPSGPHRPGDRGPAARRRWPDQRRDRREALRVRQDGRASRVSDTRQARRHQSSRGGQDGPPARPRYPTRRVRASGSRCRMTIPGGAVAVVRVPRRGGLSTAPSYPQAVPD